LNVFRPFRLPSLERFDASHNTAFYAKAQLAAVSLRKVLSAVEMTSEGLKVILS